MTPALGMDFNDVPGIRVAADPGAVLAQQPQRTNAALQLADALGDLHPAARRAGYVYAQKKQDEAEAQAKVDALKTMGQDFAEATRRGLIEPTQNPWYMQAYAKESAYVRSQQDLSSLNAEAANWSEQNDPQAFQKKYLERIGQLSEKFGKDPDAQKGFLAAAAPAQQQAFASNTAINVERIKRERQDNMGSLIAQSVGEANRTNGGNASPSQIMDSLGSIKEAWISTGGTEAAWKELVVKGVTSAAYNQQDADLLDVLKGAGLYDLPGVADSVEADRYRIELASKNGLRDALDAERAKREAKALEIQGKAFGDPRFGLRLLTGDFSLDDFVQTYTNDGYAPTEIRTALNQIQAGVADSVSLNAARLQSYSRDPQNAPELFGLLQEGEVNGYSQDLADRWGDMVLSGRVPYDDAARAVGQAISRSTSIRIATQQAERLDPDYIGNYGNLSQRVKDQVSAMAETYKDSRGGRPISQAQRDRLEVAANDAARAWLTMNPGDWYGANQQAEMATTEWFIQQRARDAARQAPAGGNPLRPTEGAPKAPAAQPPKLPNSPRPLKPPVPLNPKGMIEQGNSTPGDPVDWPDGPPELVPIEVPKEGVLLLPSTKADDNYESILERYRGDPKKRNFGKFETLEDAEAHVLKLKEE